MTAAIAALSFAETLAFDAIARCAELGTQFLPYSTELHAALVAQGTGCTAQREYLSISCRTLVEVSGENADGEWCVVLRMPFAPQAARYR